MASKRRIPLSCLGPAAIAQIRATGFDVDKQIQKEQAGHRLQRPVTSPSNFSRDNKYGVSAKDQRTFNGIVFDSKFEMNAYRFLLERGVEFERQVEFVLQEGFRHDGKWIRPIKYIADFKVRGNAGWHIIDTKGMMTDTFLVKKKMMLAQGHVINCIKNLGDLATFLVAHGCLERQPA